MRRCRQLSLIVVLAFSLSLGIAADAGATSINAIATTSSESQTASFGIFFAEPPDFATTDAFGRLATSFQFYINTENEVTYPGQYLIRRNESSPSGYVTVVKVAPQDGSWGPVVGTAPYVQDGVFVGFTLPLAVFNAREEGFYWALDVFEYGQSQGGFAAAGHAVPGAVPSAVPDQGSTLLLLATAWVGLSWLRRKSAMQRGFASTRRF